MRLRIVLAGKIKERYLQQGVAEYLRRLRVYARVELAEVGDEPVPDRAAAADLARLREREAERLLRAVPAGDYLVALDAAGRSFSSEALAAWLTDRAVYSEPNLSFAIGGTTGLAPAVRDGAQLVLSLGPMTFPHQMVPLLLLEQIYRAFRIQRNEPYHW